MPPTRVASPSSPHRIAATWCCLLLAGLSLAGPSAMAHGLDYQVGQATAVVVQLHDGDGTPLAFQAYEIYPDGSNRPSQVGQSDAVGRVAFLPDRAGKWRVRVVAEHGHGLDFSLDTDAAATVTVVERPFLERHARILIGVALILGLFGVASLFLRRKRA